MAKKSVSHRNKIRVEAVARMKEFRDHLRASVIDQSLTEEQRWDAVLKLQKLPRDTSPVRRRNRCKFCGRPRAYNRLTGLCRLHMRNAIIAGLVPGIHYASW